MSTRITPEHLGRAAWSTLSRNGSGHRAISKARGRRMILAGAAEKNRISSVSGIDDDRGRSGPAAWCAGVERLVHGLFRRRRCGLWY